MNLLESLRINKPVTLAAIGAGGKTSFLFTFAKESNRKCIISTTTHISLEQSYAGDYRIVEGDPEMFNKIMDAPDDAIIVIVGTESGIERINGPSEDTLSEIRGVCEREGIPLLIEAGGSKKLPLKAPGEYEPVIPDWVEFVVQVVGCQAIGKAVNEDTIFRVDQYQNITRQNIGDKIDFDSICNLLLHPNGGRKGIFNNQRSIVFLNHFQLDIERIEPSEQNIYRLLEKYDSVLVGNLDKTVMEPTRISAVYEQNAAVILAAGGSTRLGNDNIKQLLTYEGETFLRRTVKSALNGPFSNVFVVLGYEFDRLKKEVDDLPVEIIANPRWEKGQSTSVIAAVQRLNRVDGLGGALFIPIDQPYLSAKTMQQIVRCHTQNVGKAIIPKSGQQTGSPVFFDKIFSSQLLKLSGDKGGRAILKNVPHVYCEIDDEKVFQDIDTMDAYYNFLEENQSFS